jgi:transcriptional regulator with XRE-family HTH domain
MFAYQSSCSYKLAVKKTAYLAQQQKLLALLRQLRIEAGLTQAQLAERLQRDQTFVSKYESGERRLDILEIRDVCRGIGIGFVDAMRRLDRELK